MVYICIYGLCICMVYSMVVTTSLHDILIMAAVLQDTASRLKTLCFLRHTGLLIKSWMHHV